MKLTGVSLCGAEKQEAVDARNRLSAAARIWPANVDERRYVTLTGLPDGCQVFLGTRPSLAAELAAESAVRRQRPIDDRSGWPRIGPFDPLLKYGGLKSGHPQQMERASTMFMSTRQAIERLRLATDSPSMRTVRSALDGQDRTASTGCLWQGDRQA